MKNNKLMKLLLPLLVVFTISSTNADILSQITTISYDSQIELFNEDSESSPFDKLNKQ